MVNIFLEWIFSRTECFHVWIFFRGEHFQGGVWVSHSLIGLVSSFINGSFIQVGGGRVGWHGGAQGGKGGHQGVYEYKVNIKVMSLSIVRGLISNWPQVCKIHINFLFKKVLHRQMTGPVQLNIDFSSIESILPLDWYSGAIWIHKMEFLFKIFIKQDPLVTKGQFRFSSIWVSRDGNSNSIL